MFKSKIRDYTLLILILAFIALIGALFPTKAGVVLSIYVAMVVITAFEVIQKVR